MVWCAAPRMGAKMRHVHIDEGRDSVGYRLEVRNDAPEAILLTGLLRVVSASGVVAAPLEDEWFPLHDELGDARDTVRLPRGGHARFRLTTILRARSRTAVFGVRCPSVRTGTLAPLTLIWRPDAPAAAQPHAVLEVLLLSDPPEAIGRERRWYAIDARGVVRRVLPQDQPPQSSSGPPSGAYARLRASMSSGERLIRALVSSLRSTTRRP